MYKGNQEVVCIKHDIPNDIHVGDRLNVLSAHIVDQLVPVYRLQHEDGRIVNTVDRFVTVDVWEKIKDQYVNVTVEFDKPTIMYDEDSSVVNDYVEHPSHYTDGGIEVIDYIEAKLTDEQFEGFLLGNVLKYSSRAGKKFDKVEDLKKAQKYLEWLVKKVEV